MINKVLIIAEAGVNHNCSLENAKKLILAGAEAGVDYVKFQTFKSESLVSKFAKKASGLIKNIESVTKEGSVELWIDPANTTVINGIDYWLVNRYFGKDADTSGKPALDHLRSNLKVVG